MKLPRPNFNHILTSLKLLLQSSYWKRKLRFSFIFAAILVGILFGTAADAAINITPTTATTTLVTQLTGNNVTISNLTINQGNTGNQIGTFTGGTTGGAGSVIGIDNGVAMITGTATSALGPNNSYRLSTGGETGPNDTDLATVDSGTQYDTAILQFNIVPAGNTLAVKFAFASEEYNEYVCTIFNDAMGLFISGPGITGKVNLARLSTTQQPISVNTVNRGIAGAYSTNYPAPCDLTNNAFYVKNLPDSANETITFDSSISSAYTNLQYDGFTVPLSATIGVTPNATYTIKIVLADIGDASWDSAVFIDAIESYNLDLGDAPNSYGTVPVNGTIQIPGPARHSTGQNIYLGAIAPDLESTLTAATSPNAANSDDTTGSDDEDAFSSDLVALTGITSYKINNIPVVNTTGSSGLLMGWIDFNKNGSFSDAGELASVTVANGQSTANLNWSGFSATTAGTTYARFRITTDTTLTSSPSSVGLANNGEVEDYRVSIISPANVMLIKRITAINGDRAKNPNDNTALNTVLDNPNTTNDTNANWPSNFLVGAYNAGKIKPGDEIEYTVYFMNASGSSASNVRLCDRVVGSQTFVNNAYGTSQDIEYKLGTNTVRYLTKGVDTSRDRAYLDSSTGTISGCPVPTITGTNNGTVVIDITGSGSSVQDNITSIPGATGQGTPTNSYGYFRFKTKVNN
jgi:hypothetical protein